ncbi:unnamed protein product [Pieris brassicae]|uniref:Uncharacterized protein n=1 Tax=Pieris brassicae TaxID=7116 RepID=A0A9P0TH40_PIEBR|nr:unnamed protein product [Pieris brassicae]
MSDVLSESGEQSRKGGAQLGRSPLRLGGGAATQPARFGNGAISCCALINSKQAGVERAVPRPGSAVSRNVGRGALISGGK